MKLARNTIKQANKKLQTVKSNMLRKKSKYDPKYSGKPTVVDNVGNVVISKVWKQTSVSGILILLLIGYIVFEQVSKKSASETKLLDDRVEAGVQNSHDKGKVMEELSQDDLNDINAGQRAKDNHYGPANPKIQGVNDFIEDRRAAPKEQFRHDDHYLHKPKLPEVPANLRHELLGEDEVIEDLGDIDLPPKAQEEHREIELPKDEANKGYHKPHFPEYQAEFKAYNNAKNRNDPQSKKFPVAGPRYDPVQKREVLHPNPKNFPVKILHAPQMECSEPLTLLLIIHSQAQNYGTRKVIRDVWGIQDPEKYQRFGSIPKWKTIFVIGKPQYTIAEEQINKEADAHKDLLQGDFVDNKYEDTRKFMMTMNWIYSNIGSCTPKFVMKSQDDIYHNMFSIIDWLGKKFSPDDKNIYIGRLLREDVPIRDPQNPMYVPTSDYARPIFPNLIQGPVYLFDFPTYKTLTGHMNLVTPIALEEGYIGIVAERAGLIPVHNDHFMLLERSSNYCHNLRLFFLYKVKPSEHYDIFHKNKNARDSNQCKNAQVIERDGKKYDIEM